MGGCSPTIYGAIGRLFESGCIAGLDDSELLSRVATTADREAFAALIARHAPMVLGVCRRALRCRSDADDAFQATFLILARKAASIREGDRLGCWLFGVSRRVAARARADARRRGEVERRASRDEVVTRAEADRLDLLSDLDDELARLPSRFREAIVLCHLAGLTHEEAAHRLRCPVGTVKSRVARGLARLRMRMTRPGALPALALVTAVMAPTAAPASLIESTARCIPNGPWTQATSALVRGVLRTMSMKRLMTIATACLVVGLTLTGAFLAPAQYIPATPVAKPAAPRSTHQELPTSESPGAIRFMGRARGLVVRLERDASSQALAFMPDGKSLVVGCGDGLIRILDAATGRVTSTLVHHAGPELRSVTAIAVRPDGLAVASGGEDGRARLWDLATKKTPVDLSHEPSGVPPAGRAADRFEPIAAGHLGPRVLARRQDPGMERGLGWRPLHGARPGRMPRPALQRAGEAGQGESRRPQWSGQLHHLLARRQSPSLELGATTRAPDSRTWPPAGRWPISPRRGRCITSPSHPTARRSPRPGQAQSSRSVARFPPVS